MKSKKIEHIKTTGFKVPKGYFDTFEDRLMQNLDDHSFIQGIDETGFKVPNNYFEKVDEQILEKVSKNNTPVIQISTRRKLYYFTGVAAALIIALSIFFNRQSTVTISTEMVEIYFQNSDLNSYELAELLIEAEFLEDDFNLIETSYNEDNLESYLLEHADLESYIE